MRIAIVILAVLSICSVWAQEQPQLDEKFVDSSNLIDYENAPEINSWGKEDTFSSFLHLRERLSSNQNPVFVFVVDGGDLFEAENIAKFLNSPEGRSFRTVANYFVVDSRILSQSKVLKKKLVPGGNMYLMNRNFEVMAQTKINYYQTKKGSDWWEKIKKFLNQNQQVVKKITERMRDRSDMELVKRFDDSLEKIKNASFKERRKAIKAMKSIMPEMGFLLLPATNDKDPELSRTAEKLLLESQTSLNFPVTRKVPTWFNFDKQVTLLTKK